MINTDDKKMVAYICRRIPELESTRIALVDGRDGIVADLMSLPDGCGGYDLEIESNCPEWVTLITATDDLEREDIVEVRKEPPSIFFTLQPAVSGET